jgi:HK97 gp10 family phage protein
MIKGLSELTAQLRRIEDVDKGKALLAGALTLQKYSMQNTPVDTGFLKNSHESREVDDGAEMAVMANYAFYIEYGTSKMAAQPFVRPAIDEHFDDITRAVGKQVEAEIRGKI